MTKRKSSQKAVRLLIADDHLMFRLGVESAVALEGDMEIIAQASTGNAAVEAHREHRPDVTLMDLRMPDLDGIQATAKIRAEFPEARVILLSSYDGNESIHDAMEAGARCYLSKDISNSDLIDAIRKVHSGAVFLPNSIAKRLAERPGERKLTPREQETLIQIVMGRSNKEIGDRLGIAESTVKVHLRNLFVKLGVLDRTQAAILSLREGLVSLDGKRG